MEYTIKYQWINVKYNAKRKKKKEKHMYCISSLMNAAFVATQKSKDS